MSDEQSSEQVKSHHGLTNLSSRKKLNWLHSDYKLKHLKMQVNWKEDIILIGWVDLMATSYIWYKDESVSYPGYTAQSEKGRQRTYAF